MSDLKESNDSLPVDEERIKDAIRKLIEEFGMDKLTSRIIRNKLGETFETDFTTYREMIDKITMKIVEESKAGGAESQKKDSDSNKSASESDDGVVFTDKSKRRKSKGIRKRKASESDPDSADFGQKKRRKAALSRIVIPRRKKKEVERAAKPRKKNSYNLYCALSEDLQAIVGKQYMRRCDVIKAMWTYFKSNSLLDPKDKRYVLSDGPLLKLFKKKRFLAFGVMKVLVGHIIEPKFLSEEERAALEKYGEEEDARRAAAAENNNNDVEGKEKEGDQDEKEDDQNEKEDDEDEEEADNQEKEIGNVDAEDEIPVAAN